MAPIETVAIIGRGALGIMYADAIAQAGGDPVFIMGNARYERQADEPVQVNGRECAFRCVRLSEAAPVDLVIFAVKATVLDDAIDLATPLVGPQTRLLSLLNGITSEERIAARYGWENLVFAVAQGMDAVRFGNELTYSQMGQIRFGAAPATNLEAVSSLADYLGRMGVPFVLEDDIVHRLWAKFMLNVGVNQTCMVYGGTYGTVSAPGEQNRTFVAAMREVVAVANAEGVALTEADLTGMAELMATLDPAGMPSMAQDRISRKPSEVEEFSGALIARAERHNILVPTNRWLYEQVKRIEGEY